MNLIQVLFSLFVFLYLGQAGLIYFGNRRRRFAKAEQMPRISILVAVKNEERTLRRCIQSLLDLDYPKNLLEIVLTNDRSTDRTSEIIHEFNEKSKQIKTVEIEHGISGLSGKANAIAQAMGHATGDLILVTDGDCRVPTTWAKAHAKYYSDQIGLVAGFTLLDEKGDQTPLFGRVQSLDWCYLLSVGAGLMGLGKPLSVLGNNFSFRRSAYEEVGGYQSMGFTIIEDFALMKTLVQRTSWGVLYPIDRDMLVYSHPMPSLRRFYEQRKRWSAGGKEVGLYGKFLMFVSLVVHILVPFSFFVAPLFYSVAALALILLSDLALLWRTTGLVGRRDLLKYFPAWEMFYFIYTALFAPVLLLPTTVRWKDVSYSWKFNWKVKRMT